MIHRYVARDQKKSVSDETVLSIIRCPIVTEKSTLRTENGQYFFKVAKWANKIQIRQAVEKLFSVQVEHVNTLCMEGKVKRFRGRLGKRSDYKKAMVSLKKGQTLDLFKGAVS